jgi:hypothetical protein
MPNDQEWWAEAKTDAANIFGDCVPETLIPWLIAEVQRKTWEEAKELINKTESCGCTCWQTKLLDAIDSKLKPE